MSNDLILEVEESIREEKMQQLWDEYGGYLIAACVLTVLFTALFVGWNSWDEKVSKTQTTVLIEALETEESVSESVLAVTPALSDGRKALALLTAAGAYVQDGEFASALPIYESLFNDMTLPERFREFAQLLSVKTQWDLRGVETEASEDGEAIAVSADARDLTAQLTKIVVNEGSPWRYHAMIQSAVIYAAGLSDYSAAINLLSEVESRQNLPQSLRSRAQALQHVYTLKQSEIEASAAAEGEPQS